MAAAAPAELRNFCLDALRLDGRFQIISEYAFQSADRGRDEALGIIRGLVKDLPADPAGERSSGGDSLMELFALGARTEARVQLTRQMLKDFAQTKRTENMHQRWASLLAGLAEADPGLRRFAARPQDSDPSWHYMRNRLAGDAYPGLSVALSRTGVGPKYSMQIVTRPIGDIRQGPVRVRLPLHGAYIYNLTMTGVSNGMIFAGQCARGHLSLWHTSGESAWAASGMTDNRKHGRLEFPGEAASRPVQVEMRVCHMPMSGDDQEVEGSVLIYLDRQFRSNAEAAAVARNVDL